MTVFVQATINRAYDPATDLSTALKRVLERKNRSLREGSSSFIYGQQEKLYRKMKKYTRKNVP